MNTGTEVVELMADRPADRRHSDWEVWRDKHEAVCTVRWENATKAISRLDITIQDVRETQNKMLWAIVGGLGATVVLLLSILMTLLVSHKGG